MKNTSLGKLYLEELEAEIPSTRKCLERVSPELFGWKPHQKSMTLGDLALLVAEIPRWITYIIEKGEIDFVTFGHFRPETTSALVQHFDENLEGAKKALENVKDEQLSGIFYLKNQRKVLFSSPIKDNIGSSINHMVHHRGQLTVYMRLNNIPVPSIYGPSADDKVF